LTLASSDSQENPSANIFASRQNIWLHKPTRTFILEVEYADFLLFSIITIISCTLTPYRHGVNFKDELQFIADAWLFMQQQQ